MTSITGSTQTVAILTQGMPDDPCSMTVTTKTINSRPSSSQSITFTTTDGNLIIDPADYTWIGAYSVTFTITLDSG